MSRSLLSRSMTALFCGLCYVAGLAQTEARKLSIYTVHEIAPLVMVDAGSLKLWQEGKREAIAPAFRATLQRLEEFDRQWGRYAKADGYEGALRVATASLRDDRRELQMLYLTDLVISQKMPPLEPNTTQFSARRNGQICLAAAEVEVARIVSRNDYRVYFRTSLTTSYDFERGAITVSGVSREGRATRKITQYLSSTSRMATDYKWEFRIVKRDGTEFDGIRISASEAERLQQLSGNFVKADILGTIVRGPQRPELRVEAVVARFESGWLVFTDNDLLPVATKAPSGAQKKQPK